MITLSWSTINSWHICPLKVKHEMDGVKHPSSWAICYGDAGHVALKAWAEGKNWLEVFEQECLSYERRTAKIKDWNGEFTDTERGTIQKVQVKHLLERYIADQTAKPNPELVEKFLSRLLQDDIILTGKIDWLGDPIVDWKFTSNPDYINKLQGIIYAILNGGPCEFEFHALVKARNPYWTPVPVPETQIQDNLDRVLEYVVLPVAKNIGRCIENPELWEAHPTEYLCKEKWCGYWEVCTGRLV